MSNTTDRFKNNQANHDPNRRDFLNIMVGSLGAVSAGFVAWPLIDQMNPDSGTLALASVDIDVSQIEAGQIVTIKWRGKPVFVRRRSAQEIEETEKIPVDSLIDPLARNSNLASDIVADDKSRSSKDGSVVLVLGICTHLGCVPVGNQGQFGGWFCPCHGSEYDSLGRVRRGPAPENLAIPKFKFVSDSVIRVG